MDTGVRRELANSAYNERRRQCEEAAQMFHDIIVQQDQAGHTIHALRDVTREQFARYGSQLPDLLRRRAGYVIAEDARVLSAAKLLEESLIKQVGPLLCHPQAALHAGHEVNPVDLTPLVEIPC